MIFRRQVGWCVAQAFRMIGARVRSVRACRQPGVMLPIVCHALPADDLDRLLGWLKRRNVSVWLSFDDGWKETLDCVPVLERYNQKALLFIAPGAVIQGNVWTDAAQQLRIPSDVWRTWYGLAVSDREACLAAAGTQVKRRLMDVSEVKDLARHPLIEIGNHTWSHPSAPHRPAEEFLREVEKTQGTLEAWTGQTPRFCAYPFGRGTPELDAELKKRSLTPVYTRQGRSTFQTLGEARNMAIEDVSFAENLGRVLMAWPRVGVTL